MPFVPWAWTPFPVEPENGIAVLTNGGHIGLVWDTVFFGPGLDSLIHGKGDPKIRALCGPGLPLRTPFFRNYVPKRVQFYTLFQESPYSRDLRQTGHFTGMYQTLLYAFGRQNSGPNGVEQGSMKRGPVLAAAGFFTTGFFRDQGAASPGHIPPLPAMSEKKISLITTFMDIRVDQLPERFT